MSLVGDSLEHGYGDEAVSEMIETEFRRYDIWAHPIVTIRIGMSNDMQFTPVTIQVKQ